MANELNEMNLARRTADRRRFLKGAGITGLGIASTALMGNGSAIAQSSPSTTALTATDIAVLNFALNLEYLEAEFYTRAFYGRTIEQFGIPTGGMGTPGATKGGEKVNFAETESIYRDEQEEFSGRLRAIAKQITVDEQTHVKLLHGLLGSNAVAKPAIDLDALGKGFESFKEFLALARVFEDVGVSAYGGAVTLLSTTALSYAARIGLAEAYHASNIRLLCAENHVPSPAVDQLDVPPPPVGTEYFNLDNSALAVVRTTSQVLAIVYGNSAKGTNKGGFFPNGLNGAITTV